MNTLEVTRISLRFPKEFEAFPLALIIIIKKSLCFFPNHQGEPGCGAPRKD